MSLLIKLPKGASKSSDTPQARRKPVKRISSPVDDETTVASAPPLKRPRIQRSPDSSDEDEALDSPEASRQPARVPPASSSRAKPKPPTKKRSKVVISDPESEELELVDDESEAELPVDEEDDDDEYMSEPKNPVKRAGGGKGKVAQGAKGKKKPEPREIMAKDERKRPLDASEPAAAPAAKRPRPKLPHKTGGELIVDVVGDAPAALGTPPTKEDTAPAPPKKSKLPPIKKNKAPTAASGGSAAASAGAGTSTASIPPKPAPLATARVEEDSKLPPPIVAPRKATIPASVDVDLSNPALYAQLFKSGGGSTPSGFTRREKDEERRKELNRMRDEARAKRINEAAPAFDLQGQMDKISRFEERLRNSRSPAVYPNFLAGALKSLQLGKKYYASNDLEPREEGEM
ncbi:hypothetical protein FB451DRAFT_739177 [Mycena latifolia]|nr:hypothetical protein FB451DRAFT_739177 [Mycena latifolia]